jgi:lipid-binding SYLF domain-containing protein
MKTIRRISLVSILAITVGILLGAPSNGDSKSVENEKAIETLIKTAMVLDNITEDPVSGIPQSLISKSEGIMIFPGACKVAAGPFNKHGGRGIAMIHNEDGSWSKPFFVTFREGSLGFPMGTKASDIILLFKDRNDIMGITNSEITLGGDLGVVPGPIHNGSSLSEDITFGTDVFSYHRCKETFSGVSFTGGVLSYLEKPSDTFNGIEYTELDESLIEIETPYYEKVNSLLMALER